MYNKLAAIRRRRSLVIKRRLHQGSTSLWTDITITQWVLAILFTSITTMIPLPTKTHDFSLTYYVLVYAQCSGGGGCLP